MSSSSNAPWKLWFPLVLTAASCSPIKTMSKIYARERGCELSSVASEYESTVNRTVLSGCGDPAWIYWANAKRDEVKTYVDEPARLFAHTARCDVAEVQVSLLATNHVGVEGCGYRATYVLTYGSGWVANTISDANGTPSVAEERSSGSGA